MENWEITLAKGLRRQWKRYAETLKCCQKHFSEKSVHDSRVECRRLLAHIELLSHFTSKKQLMRARRALKHHLDIFKSLRDTQVQLWILESDLSFLGHTKELRHLLRHREKRCLNKAKSCVQKIKTGRLKTIVAGFINQLEGVTRTAARLGREREAVLDSVEAAYAHVVERRRQIDPRDVSTLHRTRVAFKKFRYMVEALQPSLPQVSKTSLRAMRRFQRLLGDLQDSVVFLAQIRKFIRSGSISRAKARPFERWLEERRASQICQCMERADVIFEFWPFARRLDSRYARK